jgi:monofunctional biosynthetic peptidoglycan transglycosylase
MGMPMRRAAGKSRRASIWLTGIAVVGAVAFAAVAYMYLTLPDVRGLAVANPTTTAFMEMRAREAEAEGKEAHRVYTWVPYRRISPHLKRAVLVAEDSAFWEHEGIDLEQIKVAIETAIERGDAPRGASTITQQLAKNLYLSPSYDPFRKLQELIITRRLEAELPKARILELYLNVVEWGDGVWGAEAAARRYFGVPAASLSRAQSALMAGALINPIRYSPGRPPPRLLRRQQIILGRMGSVEPPPASVEVAPARTADNAQAEPDTEPAHEVPEVSADPVAGDVEPAPAAQP